MLTTDQLVEKLLAAATSAITRERGALAFDAHRVRSITLEIGVDQKGAIIEKSMYVERIPPSQARQPRD